MSARDAHLASVVLGMRTPLARIRLGASQLGREAETPAARSLALAIGEAVAELDAQIDLSVSLLLPPSRETSAGDATSALEALRVRLTPVLEARGLSWEAPPEMGAVRGDPDEVRRAGALLLRAGLTAASPGSRLTLAAREDDGRAGVRLSFEPEAQDAQPATPETESALEAARLFALSRRGALEEAQGCWTLWLGAPS